MTQCPCQWNIKLPLIINRVSYFSFRSRLVERPQYTLSSLCEMQWRGREEYVLHCWRELYPMPYNELWSKRSKRGVLYLQMFWKLTREQSDVFLKNDLRSSWCFGQMTCEKPDVLKKYPVKILMFWENNLWKILMFWQMTWKSRIRKISVYLYICWDFIELNQMFRKMTLYIQKLRNWLLISRCLGKWLFVSRC